mmetsp:Transcript_99230/g.285058  ORF Transcript_99230/g.285058 Transcript_99230/m.285058 type:complete len:255 (-) Transcript_99230:807-1571(-)
MQLKEHCQARCARAAQAATRKRDPGTIGVCGQGVKQRNCAAVAQVRSGEVVGRVELPIDAHNDRHLADAMQRLRIGLDMPSATTFDVSLAHTACQLGLEWFIRRRSPRQRRLKQFAKGLRSLQLEGEAHTGQHKIMVRYVRPFARLPEVPIMAAGNWWTRLPAGRRRAPLQSAELRYLRPRHGSERAQEREAIGRRPAYCALTGGGSCALGTAWNRSRRGRNVVSLVVPQAPLNRQRRGVFRRRCRHRNAFVQC